jgi:hypothetical protein
MLRRKLHEHRLVAIYLLRCADVLGVDVATAVKDKLAINESRFAEA